MRIWTLHPKYLDAQGLVALWRETLLARKVLNGQTVGYKAHPQLVRFRAQPDPVAAIDAYLLGVYGQAVQRGYHFDARKIGPQFNAAQIDETEGQLLYEWRHLKTKLQTRHPCHLAQLYGVEFPDPHLLFRIIPGEVRDWERVK